MQLLGIAATVRHRNRDAVGRKYKMRLGAEMVQNTCESLPDPIYNGLDKTRVVEKRADFLYRQVLLLEQEIPELAPTKDPARLPQFVAGRVIDNTINEFTIEIVMPADGLVLLSENYYPAWRAEEQGVPLTIYRANYTFRAVFAKAGPHTIHFWFDNPRYDQGKLMSAVCLLVLLAGRVATGRRKRVTPQSGQV